MCCRHLFTECTWRNCGVRIADCGLRNEFENEDFMNDASNPASGSNPQLQIPNQSAIRNPQSAIQDHSAIRNPQSAIDTSITLWGSGSPLREFLYVEDMADACVFLMQNLEAEELYNSGITHINIGSGEEITIKDLAELIKSIVGFEGEIQWDSSKPDGTPRKLMDSSRLRSLGWKPSTPLPEGIKKAYQDFFSRH